MAAYDVFLSYFVFGVAVTVCLLYFCAYIAFGVILGVATAVFDLLTHAAMRVTHAVIATLTRAHEFEKTHDVTATLKI